MPVLSARGLTKAYGPQTLFTGIDLTVRRGERVGLLGINGTGKSTLLRILAGLEPTDAGVVERRRDATILYLPQEPELDPDKTPRTLVEEGLAAWKAATNDFARISQRLSDGHADDALLAEQAALGERIEHLGGWTRGHVVEDYLGRLGISELDRPVGTMSGGEQRRVALAQVLVARPDLAILDEPTNHLDADTIGWLEQHFTEEFPGAVLMVTHDRYVLDALADRIVELDRGMLVETQGGYGDYLEQKAERLSHEERTEQSRLNILRRETAWLRRGAKARSTKQKARIQRAKALGEAEPTRAPTAVDLADLGVTAPRLGGRILDLLGLDVILPNGRVLIRGLDLRLVDGDRVGIVGPNGAGKTSLLRVITGEQQPDGGRVEAGNKTRITLFDQARAGLIDDWSIFDNVAEMEGASRRGAGVVRIGERTFEMPSYLELFLFDGYKQRQKVGALSGGERARVALAKLLRSGANLLLLDEPTNDLDVATLGSLEELLLGWPGAAIVVSHDRYFLDRVATSILAFEGDGRVVHYPGNYSTYRSLRDASLAAAKAAEAPPKARADAPKRASSPPEKAIAKGLSYAERKELEVILDLVTAAEERALGIEARLADPAFYASEASEAGRLATELGVAQADLARLLARWEELEARKAVKA
jgi:ATP-binding cassette subfamily F protein uup